MYSSDPTGPKPISSIDGIVPRQKQMTRKKATRPKLSIQLKPRHLAAWGGAGLVTIAVMVAGILIRAKHAHHVNSEPIATPFTADIMASVKFPLYYPTKLPSGFHIDQRTVTEPQANVVVFDIVAPTGQKLYMSEEDSPAHINILNYDNNLVDLQKNYTAERNIAVGFLVYNHELVGSWSNSDTWIIVSCHADITRGQIMAMLLSLKLSY